MGGYFVRNVYDFDCKAATSFWYVIKDNFGGMEEFSSKMRNQVRKSLKIYDVKKIDRNEFLKIALPIYNEALSSYRVKAKETTYRDIEKATERGNLDFFAVYKKETGEAVAVALNTVTPKFCYYNTLKARPSAMHNSTYPYYGLIYEMNRYYLDTLGLNYVCDGARTITNHSNVQNFLEEKFLFRKAYCRLRIIYKPWLKVVVDLLFPFRRIMPLKIRSVLNMEAMSRGKM